MKYNEVNWAKAWRGLAMTFCCAKDTCSKKAVVKWAKENKFVPRMINDVIEALAMAACQGKCLAVPQRAGHVVHVGKSGT